MKMRTYRLHYRYAKPAPNPFTGKEGFLCTDGGSIDFFAKNDIEAKMTSVGKIESMVNSPWFNMSEWSLIFPDRLEHVRQVQ